MWPFSRKADATNQGEPVVPQIHFDWKGLPPIQRTLADHPLTIPTQAFAAELATHDDPRAVAKPLGHMVSLDAPPGIVVGIARPQTRTGGPELVAATRPRRRPAVQRTPDKSMTSDIDALDLDDSIVETPTAPTAPLRRLPVSAEPLPSIQLTSVTPENEPQPLLPLQEVAMVAEPQPAEAAETKESVDAATELPFYPRLTLGQARRLGLGAPIPRVPDTATSVQRSSEASLSPTTLSPTTPSPPSASTAKAEDVPQFQPFPLDVLINKWPEVVAPAPISRPQRIASPLTVARSVWPERPRDSESSIEPIDATRSEPELTASASPTVPVQRFAASPAGDGVTPDQAGLSLAPDPRRTMLTDTRTGEAEESPAAPRPAPPLATEPDVEDVWAIDEGGPDASPKPVDPESGDDSSTAAPHLDVALATSTEAPTIAPLVSERRHLGTAVQRTTDSAPSPARAATGGGGEHDVVPGRALLLHEGAQVDARRTGLEMESMKDHSVDANHPLPVARSAFSPAPTSPQGQTMPLVQRSSALETWPSVQTASGLEARPSVQTLSVLAARPSVQTSTAVLESAIDDRTDSTVQRAPVQEWSVSAAADLSSNTGTAGPPAAGETPAPGKDEEARMEDLAGKLYDRIRIRLHNELLVDRERAGFLTDLR